MLYKFLRPAALLVIVIVILGLCGIRIGHPQSGLKNALGSAQSSLVIYRSSHSLGQGSKAVVVTHNPKADPALVFIRGVEATTVDIQSQGILQRIPKKDINGKLILVIPFLGYLF